MVERSCEIVGNDKLGPISTELLEYYNQNVAITAKTDSLIGKHYPRWFNTSRKRRYRIIHDAMGVTRFLDFLKRMGRSI